MTDDELAVHFFTGPQNRQGSFAARIKANARPTENGTPMLERSSTTGGTSASGAPQSHLQYSRANSQTFKRAVDMTDDELAAIASGATLHVVK